MFTLNSCYLAKNRNISWLQKNKKFAYMTSSYLTVVNTCARWALALSMQYL